MNYSGLNVPLRSLSESMVNAADLVRLCVYLLTSTVGCQHYRDILRLE